MTNLITKRFAQDKIIKYLKGLVWSTSLKVKNLKDHSDNTNPY